MRKLAVLLALWAPAVSAAEIQPGCFDVISADGHTIMLDRCTGSTWGLVQTAPDDRGYFSFVWTPFTLTKEPIPRFTSQSREIADQTRAVRSANEAGASLADERAAHAMETLRLRTVLGREPTSIEVSYCVAKSPRCPSPKP